MVTLIAVQLSSVRLSSLDKNLELYLVGNIIIHVIWRLNSADINLDIILSVLSQATELLVFCSIVRKIKVQFIAQNIIKLCNLCM
jgi:hypothetical protein